MARPPTHGPDVVAQDIQRLTRVLRRAQDNDERPRKENQELIASLNRCIALLAGSMRVNVSRRAG